LEIYSRVSCPRLGAHPAQLLIKRCQIGELPRWETGEPGTGKTECASYLAWKLGYRERLIFEAKSNSEARDLFYTHDTLGRFHAKDNNGAKPDASDFIHYNTLCAAILQTQPRGKVEQALSAKGWDHYGPAQSVVLIDEIDKAPRDFPNDLLNEIDRLYFKTSELDNQVIRASEGFEPVLVIASRRCSTCVYTPITSDICATRSNAPAKGVRPADSMGANTRLRRG
jgi:hypothetical protein